MADTKVSAIAAVVTVLGTDQIPVNESGTSKRMTVQQLTDWQFVNKPYAPGSFSVPTGNYANMVSRLTLTGSQRGTLAGTARLRIN